MFCPIYVILCNFDVVSVHPILSPITYMNRFFVKFIDKQLGLRWPLELHM